MLENHYCRVCGLDQGFPTWDEHGIPSWAICSCCGAEFGYHDNNLNAIRANRKTWLNNSAQWFQPKEKPDDWNLDQQLQQIPDTYK